MNLRNHSGSIAHIAQRAMRRSPITTSPLCTAGVLRSSFSTVRERTTRNTPRSTRTRTSRTRHQKDTLGCGVESSRLPHWEQQSANRGLTCRRGHSFTSYVRPQNMQKSGLPVVIRWVSDLAASLFRASFDFHAGCSRSERLRNTSTGRT